MSHFPLEVISAPPKSEIKLLLIFPHISVKEAMRQMGRGAEKILFVVNEQNQLLGSLSDGDIRRWVLTDGSLSDSIENVYTRNPIFLKENYIIEEAKHLMLKHKIEWIPVLDDEGVIHDVLLWDKLFVKEVIRPRGRRIDLPVMIMAGGKGTRLDPFTKILPKPLMPIGEKAILEIIMDKFHQFGVEEFYISVNHKSKMIKAYFEEANTAYKIHYIEEMSSLGTAGSLRFLRNEPYKTFFVSNCDIIVECDYQEIIEFHQSSTNDITLVGSFRHFRLPYGICVIENGGNLARIEEKPEYDYIVNTGMYVINKEVFDMIPENENYPITDLINKVKVTGGKVGVFPVSEKSWIDVGEWEEYRRAKKILEMDT